MTIYARITDGKVTEYPVTEENIQLRALPMDWFLPCEVQPRPDKDDANMVVEVYEVQETKVLVTYKTTTIHPQDLLDTLYEYVTRPLNRPFMGRIPSTTAFSTVVAWFEKKIEKRLDDFAKQRGYTNVFTLTTYANSKVESRRLEAERGIDLRDHTWTAFYAFLDKLSKGEVDYPSCYEDVEKQLPALTWNDQK
jgi:hypothetical protein